MNTRTKIAAISILLGACGIAWTIPSWADPRPGYVCNHNRCWYPTPPRGYSHHHHNQRRRSDNDDLAWAVGGFLLGAIVANNANESQAQSQSNTVILPPPQQRRVTVCSDEVAYDASGKPYVLRTCTERMQ